MPQQVFYYYFKNIRVWDVINDTGIPKNNQTYLIVMKEWYYATFILLLVR